MFFSLILATIGRKDELENFLIHLQQQTYLSYELIVVDQNEDQRVETVLQRFKGSIDIHHLHSEPGASRARNVGLQFARGELLTFPDDDCWYGAGLLEQVAEKLDRRKDLDGIAGKILTQDDREFARTPSQKTMVSVRNAFECSCTFSLFVRRSAAEKIGLFDETLGVGTSTPWKSSEDTDYVIRLVKQGSRLLFDPEIVVFHPSKLAQIHPKTLERAYTYGSGMGRVLKKHHYPVWQSLYYLSRPLGGMLISTFKLDSPRIKFYWNSFRGRWDGWKSR